MGLRFNEQELKEYFLLKQKEKEIKEKLSSLKKSLTNGLDFGEYEQEMFDVRWNQEERKSFDLTRFKCENPVQYENYLKIGCVKKFIVNKMKLEEKEGK